MKRCIGCGAVLQTKNEKSIGYIPKEKKESAKLCLRCFRILHYNDLKMVDTAIREYWDIGDKEDKDANKTV